MKKISLLTIAGALSIALLTPVEAAGNETFREFPRVGITINTDVLNFGGRPGLKVRALDYLAFEGYYIGLLGDFTGYSFRGMYLAPTIWDVGAFGLRPYGGLGYTSVEQEVKWRGRATTAHAGLQEGGVETRGKVTCKGSGLQLFGGVQTNPFVSVPNLFLQAEIIISLFDVEGKGTLTAHGTGHLEGYTTTSEAKAESDYSTIGLGLGLTYYF